MQNQNTNLVRKSGNDNVELLGGRKFSAESKIKALFDRIFAQNKVE